MDVVQVDREIDARGLACPGPLLSLIGAIREEPVDRVIAVLSSDAGSRTDIPAWGAMAGHVLVELTDEDGYPRCVVRKCR
jgi:TusA-related sulfurtransferase